MGGTILKIILLRGSWGIAEGVRKLIKIIDRAWLPALSSAAGARHVRNGFTFVSALWAARHALSNAGVTMAQPPPTQKKLIQQPFS